MPLYLDHHATTPCAPAVLEAMLPWFTERFGNAHSAHAYGWLAEEAVAVAREQVAGLIGAAPREIIFTSGATEANHLAILGVLEATPARAHVITSVIEHSAVLAPLAHLEAQGRVEVTRVPVSGAGLVDPEAVGAALRPDTALVSVMWANNEIGTIQPIAALGARCRAAGVPLHTDAAQAVGKILVDVERAQVDLLSLTAHKLYGPKGVGALYARRGRPRVALAPLLRGGGQEGGLRAGTVPVPLVVGLGAACALAQAELPMEGPRLAALRDALLTALRAGVPDLRINGDMAARLPHNLNVSLPGVPGDALLTALRGLALSTGAACAAGRRGASHVLSAIGLPDDLAHASLRFGLGRGTTEAHITQASAQVGEAVTRLRAEAAPRRHALAGPRLTEAARAPVVPLEATAAPPPASHTTGA